VITPPPPSNAALENTEHVGGEYERRRGEFLPWKGLTSKNSKLAENVLDQIDVN